MIGIAVGLLIMVVSEAATLADIEPFATWNTPIAWTGFILFADSVVYRSRGRSWIRSAPREFARLALVSIPLWLIFEGYNLVIQNWYYTGAVENFWLRQFGYAWAFATISPAIFEGAELVGVARGRQPADRHRATGGPAAPDDPERLKKPASTDRTWLWQILAGAVMLAIPLAVSAPIARYMAAPVWLGFIFLLDPINRRLGAPSLFADVQRGRWDRVINLSASGLLCGVLWEFWNYWARSKWHYAVPIMEHVKIFEMPVPGYLGFPPFALECFTMYVFVRRVLFPKLDYTIAL
jgi:hypothetical protein